VASRALAADAATLSDNTRGIDVAADGRVGINGAAVAGAAFSVFGTPPAAIDQSATTVTTTITGNLWQSFTPGVTGQLVSITTRNGTGTPWNATLTIYAGEGTAGAVLYTQPAVMPGTLNPVVTLNTPPSLTAGQVYTFAFASASPGAIHCDGTGTGSSYPGGRNNVGPTWDLWFQTTMARAGSVLYVTPTGRIGINTSAPTQALEVAGNVLANNVAVPSSIRFKDRVYPLDDALENLLKLSGVRFDWKPQYAAQRGFTHDLGFVAEEVEKVFPEVVMHDAEGKVTGMDYSRLTAVAVQAIKQQQAQIERLKGEAAEVERLRSENAEIKGRLQAIEAMLRDRK
jgi:hypothetical protein